jgi:O-antigen ligase
LNIFFSLWFFLKNKQTIHFKNHLSEIIVFVFFIIILINGLINKPILKGLDTYLYLLFYPLLFLFFRKNILKNIIEKSINIYTTTITLSIIYLVVINIINRKLLLSTNTYFSEPLGLIHVYYGIYVGLAATFILWLYVYKNNYLNKKINLLLFFLFLGILIYIGARIALIAVIILISITLYKKISLKRNKKLILIGVILTGSLLLSYITIPRARNDIKYGKKVYLSIKNNDKEDMIHNSWRNMYQRFLVIDYSVKELKDNFILGIGLFNVKKRISDKIINDGYIYFKPMNTHNQYLHFLLGLGIIAFLYFLFMLYHFSINYASLNYFLTFFIIVMMTESVLVRVKGLSLFFLFLLIFSQNSKSN